MRFLYRILLLLIVPLCFAGAGKKELQLTEGIQPGNLAPEINLQGIDLLSIDYVVVQFWAAYDPQSRADNIRMHNVISRSGRKNIRLVSVSLDETEAIFKGVVKADHLDESTQFYEPKGKNAEVFKKYRLRNGFANWMIDSKGMIVAKNLSPEEVLNLTNL